MFNYIILIINKYFFLKIIYFFNHILFTKIYLLPYISAKSLLKLLPNSKFLPSYSSLPNRTLLTILFIGKYIEAIVPTPTVDSR